MMSNFPVILTGLRKEKGISQKDAAVHLGISQALLSHYEKGIRECGLDFLCRAAVFYGVSCDYLLGLSGSRDGAFYSNMSEKWPDDEKLTIPTILHALGILRDSLLNTGADESCGDRIMWSVVLFQYMGFILASQGGYIPKNWVGSEVSDNKFIVNTIEGIIRSHLQPEHTGGSAKRKGEIPVCVETIISKAREHMNEILTEEILE